MKKKTQQNHNRKKIIFQILFDLNFQQKQFFNECINISDITWLNSKLRKKNNHSSKHGVLFLDSRNWQLEWMQCFSLFFHNLILVFLVLQKKREVQEIKICYHKTCLFGTKIILNWKQLRVDAKKAPCPLIACLKAGLDYLSPETLYQPRNIIHITSLTNQTLSPISFPHIRSVSQFAILGIANLFPLSYHFSRNLLSFVNTLYKPKL